MNHSPVNPAKTGRTRLHSRNICCEGYRRDDGLWDIQATLTDTKTHSCSNHERGEIKAGEPIHEMTVVVTLDLDRVIQDIRIDMPYTPFGICPNAIPPMNKIIGLQIKAGWMREVRARIPHTRSCTHVVDLLGPIATTAYQTMHFTIEARENAKGHRQAPSILNQCHSLASGSAVVKVMWPEFYRGQ